MFSTAIERLRDRRDGAGESGSDAGFTLIELMVVLLILAILLAIAIPTFLGVTKSANDRAAQSNLNTALTNAKAAYQAQGQSYTGTNVTNSTQFASSLSSSEPSLSFLTTNSASQSQISVMVSSDGNGVVMAAFSKSSNNCWLVVDNPTKVAAVAPWGATQTGAQGASVAGPVATVVVPGNAAAQQGTIFAEIKGNSVTNATMAGDCIASQPVVPTGATYEWSNTAFPAL
jgi:type IV pilus assembly protein PilA